MAGTPISFDGNNLQTSVILTQDIDHSSQPTKNFSIFSFAHANGNFSPFTSWPGKTITLTGEINGVSIADCDAQIDIFKSYFLGQDKNLDIGWNGATRRYIATATNVTAQRPGGLQYAVFTVTLNTQPFGQDTTTTTAVTATGRTLNTYSDGFTFTGNAPGQLPVFTITYSSLTATGQTSVSLGNSATGQQVTITRIWASTDVLIVDTKALTVTVNGAITDFMGAFPFFPVGAQTMTYSDTHTTRTFAETAVYNALWL